MKFCGILKMHVITVMLFKAHCTNKLLGEKTFFSLNVSIWRWEIFSLTGRAKKEKSVVNLGGQVCRGL